MELPKGYTKEEIKSVIESWNEIYDKVNNGTFPMDRESFDQVFEDDEYIDRYFWAGDAEFCITTYKETDETYLSESLYLSLEDDTESFLIEQLKKIVK